MSFFFFRSSHVFYFFFGCFGSSFFFFFFIFYYYSCILLSLFDHSTTTTTTTMESTTTTSSKTPADFLKSIRGKRVVVKLNSGVDYRGTKRFANNKDFTQLWARKLRLSSSYIKKDRSFVRVVCACVTHACVFSCLSCMDADTTALIFFHHDRYFSVLRWIHEHCDGTHRGTRVVNGLVESLTKLLCLFSSFKERTKVPKFTISPSLVQNDKTGIRQRTA